MIRTALVALLLMADGLAQAACTSGGGNLNLQIPILGDTTGWAACIRSSLIQVSTQAIVTGSTTTAFNFGQIAVRKITGNATGTAGIEISSYTLHSASMSVTAAGGLGVTYGVTAGTFTGGGSALTSLTAANISAGTAGISVTGNAGTATALAADGANCSAASFPLGVDASGAVQSCTALSASNAGTATALAANGANCAASSFPLGVDASGAVESCSASISGNAATVTTNANLTGPITSVGNATTIVGPVPTGAVDLSTVTTALATKQATGNYITALTGAVTASGPGSVAATIVGPVPASGVDLSTVTTAIALKVTKTGDTLTGPLIVDVDGQALVSARSYGAPATQFPSVTLYMANGSSASPTAVLSGEFTGAVGGRGYGTTAFAASNRSNMVFYAAENQTDTAQGHGTFFQTTPTGSTTRATRMAIAPNGGVSVGYSHGATLPQMFNVNGGAFISGSTWAAAGDLTLASNADLTISGASGHIVGAASVTASGFFGNGAGITGIIGPGIVASTIPINALNASGCTGTQSLQRNAGNTAWVCYTPAAGTGDAILSATQTFSGANTFTGSGIVVSSFTVNNYNTLGAWYTFTPSLSGSGTMTVSAGTVDHAKFMISGRTLCLSVYIYGITLGGTTSTDIRMTIPGGKTTTNSTIIAAPINDNAVWATGRGFGSGTTIIWNRIDSGNWTLTANTRIVYSGCFEVN